MSGHDTDKDQRPAQNSAGLFYAASDGSPLNLHASCVAFGDRGLLILGPSGSGKSTLALELMAYGATLVSDDRTILSKSDKEGLIATAPAPISGMIEARGMGLLAAGTIPAARICGLVDLSQVERERLPPPRERVLIGVPIPLFFKVEGRHFAPALLQWLKGGRRA